MEILFDKFKLVLTEIRSVGGSLDGDRNLRKKFRDEYEHHSDRWDCFGVLVEKKGKKLYSVHYTPMGAGSRYERLIRMYKEGRDSAKKSERKVSAFIIHIIPLDWETLYPENF